MRNAINQNGALFAAGGFAAALFVAGAAHAITDTVFRYSPAKTGYISIPPATFVPISNAYRYDKTSLIVGSSNTSKACFSAPVILPTGVVMELLDIWYQKFNDPTFQLQLLRNAFNTSSNESLVAVEPADTAGKPKAASFGITSATSTTVDNQRNNYQLIVCMTGTLNWIAAARIKFSYNSAGY
jgi:hypothetical protein